MTQFNRVAFSRFKSESHPIPTRFPPASPSSFWRQQKLQFHFRPFSFPPAGRSWLRAALSPKSASSHGSPFSLGARTSSVGIEVTLPFTYLGEKSPKGAGSAFLFLTFSSRPIEIVIAVHSPPFYRFFVSSRVKSLVLALPLFPVMVCSWDSRIVRRFRTPPPSPAGMGFFFLLSTFLLHCFMPCLDPCGNIGQSNFLGA